MRYIGKAIKRIEDPQLITGGANYVYDITPPGSLHAYFIRSQFAHAKFKLKNCSGNCYSVSELLGTKDDEAVYFGQPIAVVLNKDPYAARDEAEKVEVEYTSLDAVTDPIEASKNGSRKSKSTLNSNVFKREEVSSGDVDEAFRRAEKIVSGRLVNQRLIPSAMEPRGGVARYDGRKLTYWSSTQSVFFVKKDLERFLKNYGVNDVRVIQPSVGGAFGSKLMTYPEDFAVALLSVITGKPIKWFNTRTEDMVSTTHGRDMILDFSAGFTSEGKLLGIKGTLYFNVGAPIREVNEGSFEMATTAAQMITGHYDVNNVKIEVLGVNTNTTPIGPYRGAGRPEGSYFIERIMNIGAMELNIDQFSIREINAIKEANYLTTGLRITHDSGKYQEVLKIAKPYFEELLKKKDELRLRGERAGIGMSFPAEIASFGPYETAKVRVLPGGKVQVISGSSPHGQGDGTAFAQIAAEVLQIPMEDIEVLWGDTDLIADGQYTAGSRTVTVGGSAVYEASNRLLEKMRRLAAERLGAKIDEVTYANGKFFDEKSKKEISLKELADGSALMGVLLEESYSYVQKMYTSPYGLHIALVVVKETGEIKIEGYVALDDVGVVVNPLLAEGQVHGGVLQGVAQAILEEVIYDENGNPMTADFSTYALPTSVEGPNVVWKSLSLSKSDTPIGSKGIGELGAIAATPAVVNAIEDAIGQKIYRMPVNGQTLFHLGVL
ncbi:carbon monoxide dehydrogenase [Sulfolobales archaeon HS-7]|nr:carbon monoxide dehydrogenase [Sulfolobales archaeon HS-7]